MEIVKFPDPILLKPAEPVTDLSGWGKTVQLMFQTMVENEGCGLAAPQVGISARMFILNVTKPLVVFNPEILEYGSRLEAVEEGCLSLPGEKFKITRPRKIKAAWTDLEGNKVKATFEGITARAFQHEYDHLMGILINRK